MNNKDLERIAGLPKQYVDNVALLMNDEHFAMILSSGSIETAFALTPKHAKRLAQSLSHNIAAYEKALGVIEAKWEPGIQSPIPMSSLNQKKDKGENESK